MEKQRISWYEEKNNHVTVNVSEQMIYHVVDSHLIFMKKKSPLNPSWMRCGTFYLSSLQANSTEEFAKVFVLSKVTKTSISPGLSFAKAYTLDIDVC